MIDEHWFDSRGYRKLKYQFETIEKVEDSLDKQDISILAAAPSAGKTYMSIYIIDQYLKLNPTHKVIILAHGTTVLRTQFHEEIVKTNPSFTYKLVENFKEYDNTLNVNVCLPQTLKNKKLNNIDLLVVDEAHQFYFGEKMVSDIIKKIKPKKQLLLTGTPSIFIRKNYPIIPVTLNTIHDEGMVSDLYVEIATSSYQFDLYDYNSDDELKTNAKFNESDTKKTLDNLINKIVQRLKSFKGNDYVNLIPEWIPTLKRLQKTMIACKSQTQAKQVQKYFNKIGVKSVLSISDTDYYSEEIDVFKNDKNCLVLIVVGRGILGFNYPELINIVDMTTSQNIDRIYQLLCRVIRKHPNNEKKLFFKIAPNNLSDYYKYIMTGVLALSDDSFFTKFNGKNFNDMVIPVIKNKNKRKDNNKIIDENNNNNENDTKKKKPSKIKPIDFEGLPALDFFKDLYHKKDSLLDVYAMTTIRDVRSEFLNRNLPNYWTKEKCLESALNYKTIKEWQKNESGAYSAAFTNNWIEECCEHMREIHKRSGYWNIKENCINDAKKYKTRSEWAKISNSAYNGARYNNWIEECCEHMEEKIKLMGYWNIKENCINSALKYKTLKDWSRKESSAYRSSKINGWFDECISHMDKRILITKEMCIEDAKKYKTRSEWSKYSDSIYTAAHRKNWFDECVKHMENLTPTPNNKPKGYWNIKENCIDSTKKYNKIGQWLKFNQQAYRSSKNNGWLEEIKEIFNNKTNNIT